MQQEEKLTAHQKIRKFVAKYAKPAGIFFIAILVLFVVVQIIGVANEKKIEKATLEIEDIQSRYVQTLEEKEDAAFEDVKGYIDELDGVIAKYPKMYAGRRALFLKGDLYFKFENYEQAAAAFNSFAEKYPDSYLAPISIYNTGVCQEKLGKLAEAETEYLKVLNKYKSEYAFMPKLIFSIGRICETQKKYADAEKYYQMVTDEYSDSNYSLFAQDKIIYMKAKGFLN